MTTSGRISAYRRSLSSVASRSCNSENMASVGTQQPATAMSPATDQKGIPKSKRKLQKHLRSAGLAYVSRTGKLIPAKKVSGRLKMRKLTKQCEKFQFSALATERHRRACDSLNVPIFAPRSSVEIGPFRPNTKTKQRMLTSLRASISALVDDSRVMNFSEGKIHANDLNI